MTFKNSSLQYQSRNKILLLSLLSRFLPTLPFSNLLPSVRLLGNTKTVRGTIHGILVTTPISPRHKPLDHPLVTRPTGYCTRVGQFRPPRVICGGRDRRESTVPHICDSVHSQPEDVPTWYRPHFTGVKFPTLIQSTRSGSVSVPSLCRTRPSFSNSLRFSPREDLRSDPRRGEDRRRS